MIPKRRSPRGALGLAAMEMENKGMGSAAGADGSLLKNLAAQCAYNSRDKRLIADIGHAKRGRNGHVPGNLRHGGRRSTKRPELHRSPH